MKRFRSWSEFRPCFPCTLNLPHVYEPVCVWREWNWKVPIPGPIKHTQPYSVTYTNGIFWSFSRRSEVQPSWDARGRNVSPSAGTTIFYLIWRIKHLTSVRTLKFRPLRLNVGDVTSWISILGHVVSKFSSWFVGRLCLRVDAAVCIADLSVGCMHNPPQGIMGGV